MLTRRLSRFRTAAETAERLCREAGLEIDAETVDVVVRTWVARVAHENHETERAALAYAPPNLGALIADTIIDAAERRQPLRPRFDRDAIVYAKAPFDGGVCSVCGEPIEGRAPVALIPGPDGRSRAHPAC